MRLKLGGEWAGENPASPVAVRKLSSGVRGRLPAQPLSSGTPMPKMKSHSGAKKRFKQTGSGKLRARHAMSSHILEKKSPKYKRGLGMDVEIAKADRKTVTKLLGGNGR